MSNYFKDNRMLREQSPPEIVCKDGSQTGPFWCKASQRTAIPPKQNFALVPIGTLDTQVVAPQRLFVQSGSEMSCHPSSPLKVLMESCQLLFDSIAKVAGVQMEVLCLRSFVRFNGGLNGEVDHRSPPVVWVNLLPINRPASKVTSPSTRKASNNSSAATSTSKKDALTPLGSLFAHLLDWRTFTNWPTDAKAALYSLLPYVEDSQSEKVEDLRFRVAFTEARGQRFFQSPDYWIIVFQDKNVFPVTCCSPKMNKTSFCLLLSGSLVSFQTWSFYVIN